jgi:hypothetical protein
LTSLPLLVGILFVYTSLCLLCLFLLGAAVWLVGSLFSFCLASAEVVERKSLD